MSASNFKTFNDLANIVGAESALKMCAFWGGRSLHIPKKWSVDHPLEHLIGRDDLDHLIFSHGNRVINMPEMLLLDLRRAGQLQELIKLGASNTLSAQLLGVSTRQVINIKNQLATFDGSLYSEEA